MTPCAISVICKFHNKSKKKEENRFTSEFRIASRWASTVASHVGMVL